MNKVIEIGVPLNSLSQCEETGIWAMRGCEVDVEDGMACRDEKCLPVPVSKWPKLIIDVNK
jgi:hypothetical protein